MGSIIKKIGFTFLVSFLISGNLSGQDITNLIAQLNQTTDINNRIPLLNQIGVFYQKQNGYQKAIEYFEQSLDLSKSKGDIKRQITVLQNIAFCYMQLKDYPKATQILEQILTSQQSQKLPTLQTLEQLADLSRINQDHNKALFYNEQILEIHRQQGSMIGITNTYNNLGYLHRITGNNKQSVKYYSNAMEINKLLDKNLNDDTRAITYINTGVAYTQTKDYRNAKKYYDLALGIYTKKKYVSKQAEVYNFIAANYFVSGNNNLALSSVQLAIDLAEATNAEDVLLTSYKIISEIYQKTDDLREYQKYNQLYQNLKEKLSDKQKKEQQSLLENQVNIEKKENEIKTLIAENDRKAAQLKQSELEREKQDKDLALKANELALLKRNQELQQAEIRNQQLEKERVRQMLLLTEQKAREDKQKQAIALLEKNKELQDLALKKKEAEEKERQKELLLLEKDRKMKEQQLKDSETLQKYGIGIMALGATVLVLVVAGLYYSNKSRKQLKKQNIEIETQRQEILTQNEELYQNQEEILAQRDFIEQKNKELATTNEKMKASELVLKKAYEQLKESEIQIKEQKDILEQHNKQITSSIKAALTIQQAILPYPQKLNELLGEYFVIFKPKDVVSGDFYWLNKVEDKVVLASVDCTGHGVPGAFMSLIGNTLLDKIVRVWKILDPAEILTRLHHDIQIMLRQKDEELMGEIGNNNGMDMSLIVMENIENQGKHILFAGAKNSLLFFENGSNEAKMLDGDRKSIGGYQNEDKEFKTQTITLEKGSLIYLGSDGFEDQNDRKRKKFGEKRLITLLAQNKHLPMNNQKLILEEALAAHMQGTLQRDDISLIGIRL